MSCYEEKKMKKILGNASEIQHYLNILNGNEHNDILYVDAYYQKSRRKGKLFVPSHYEMYVWDGNHPYYMDVPKKVALFLIKGRKLSSGISNPMARYYGWKALRKNAKEI